MQNHYQVLGVSMHATEAEIKSAYKKLAMKYHPDRNQGSKFHEEHFKRIAEAYQVLSDKYSRDIYDLKLFADAARRQNAKPDIVDGFAGAGDRVYGSGGYYAKRSQQSRRDKYAYRPAKEPEKEQPAWYTRAHFIVILFWGFASILMAGYWLNSTYNQMKAEEALKRGDFVTALDYNPNYADAYVFKTRLLMQDPNPDFEQVLYTIGQAIKKAEHPTHDMYAIRGLAFAKTGAIDLAVDDYKQAISMNDSIETYWLDLGKLYAYEVKEIELAMPLLKKVIEANTSPERLFDAYLAAAYGHMYNRNLNEAINFFSKAGDLPQADAELFYQRGNCYHLNGNHDEACKDWKKAETLGSDFATIQLTSKHCN